MTQDEDALIAEAEIGEATRFFLDSEVGKCLLGIAEQEERAALLKLADVDPNDAKAVIALQNEVWRARSFAGWLVELVNRGNNALEVYKHGKMEQ